LPARRKFPFIGETLGLIDGKHWEAMGMARGLFDYLVSRQTDPEGRVNYGRPITYAKIAREVPNCPSERTLRRYLRKLRRYPYIEVQPVRIRGINKGMIVRILHPKKWANQLGMFTGTAVEKPVNNPVEKMRSARKATGHILSKPAASIWPLSTCIKKVLRKEQKSRAQETRGLTPSGAEPIRKMPEPEEAFGGDAR